jgi:hypothetical protein
MSHNFKHPLACLGLLTVTLATTGCMTMQPPSADLEYFNPLQTGSRIMTAPRILWQVRADAEAYCAKLTGVPVTPYSKPMACAHWNVKRNECTVITPAAYGVNYLGHEVRHCFEGSFHH